MLGLFAVLAIIAPTAYFFARQHRLAGRTLLRPSPWIYAIAVLPFFFFTVMLREFNDVVMPVAVLAAITIPMILAWLWIREIVQLMGLSDDAFPGRHDKALWLALMVVLPPIGVPAFCIFRRAYWTSEKPSVDAVTREIA